MPDGFEKFPVPKSYVHKCPIVLLALLGMAMGRAAACAEVSVIERDGYRKTRDVTYVVRKDTPLLADIYQPLEGKGPWPGVLVVHGGGWMIGGKTQLAFAAAEMARRGMVAVCIEYRLAPSHLFPAQWEDCRDAVRWMRSDGKKFAIDPRWVGAYGYSAGGHLVAMLGTTADQVLSDEPAKAELDSKTPESQFRIQAFVAGGAPCDFRDFPQESPSLKFWLGGTRAEKPEIYRDASPAAYVSADDAPALFFHGEKDALVPAHEAERMSQALLKFGVETQVQLIQGTGHVQAMFDEQALDTAVKFLAKHAQQGNSEQQRGKVPR